MIMSRDSVTILMCIYAYVRMCTECFRCHRWPVYAKISGLLLLRWCNGGLQYWKHCIARIDFNYATTSTAFQPRWRRTANLKVHGSSAVGVSVDYGHGGMMALIKNFLHKTFICRRYYCSVENCCALRFLSDVMMKFLCFPWEPLCVNRKNNKIRIFQLNTTK